MSSIYSNDYYGSNYESKNYKISSENNVLDSIDKRLEMLEKQKEEIQRKYGINEATLNSININDIRIKKVNKPKLEGSQNLTKIEVIKTSEKTKVNKNINYKTPEKLIDSLKYEPNINDLIQEDEFVPKFTNIKEPKSKSINPPTYDINEYIDEFINHKKDCYKPRLKYIFQLMSNGEEITKFLQKITFSIPSIKD